MKVARMHKVGGPLILEEIDTPTPGEHDVLVRVRSCGIVPNLGNILANWTTWFPDRRFRRCPPSSVWIPQAKS
jgi:alcohol dehydrogenase